MLDRRQMWFGTRERMTGIRAPKVDYDASKLGWDGGVTQLLNGGAIVRRSSASHKVYNFAWANATRDEIRQINDYADGVYGEGPIYFLDPFAMDKNLLPQYWATPRLVLKDSIVLSGGTRSTVIQYPIALTNLQGYPEVAVSYAVTNATPADRPSLFIPVPAGYTAWFGAHGVATAATSSAITVQPDGGNAERVGVLDVNDSNRFSNSWSNVTGVTLSLGAVGVSAISGMMLQVLPEGFLPMSGGFISGQGNSGVRFATNPSLQQYSAALDMSSLTAQLVEDQTWR